MKYIAILEINPNANIAKLKEIIRGLGLSPTTLNKADDALQVLAFEGELEDYYTLKDNLSSGKLNTYFSLIDIGRADSLNIEIAPETALIDTKTAWAISEWFKSGVSELATLLGGWNSQSLQPAENNLSSTTTDAKNTTYFKKLRIADQDYYLNVIPLEGENSYRFELRSTLAGGIIPAELTLRLLTQNREDFPGNVVEATGGETSLKIEVKLTKGEGIMVETEPYPDDFISETLWF